MELATQADVEAALGRSLTMEESARADFLLRRASAMVIAYLGCDPTDADTGDVPPDVVDTVALMVARVYIRAGQASGVMDGATQIQQGVGPFTLGGTFSNGNNSTAPWFEAGDKLALRPYRCGAGLVSVDLATPNTGHGLGRDRYAAQRPQRDGSDPADWRSR